MVITAIGEIPGAALQTGKDRITAKEAECVSLLAALAYADLFDYPLTLEELTCYQVGTFMPARHISLLLHTDPTLLDSVGCTDGYYYLRGRDAVVKTRRIRNAASEKPWQRAHAYARRLAHVPYLRMAAVTGSLSMSNIADGSSRSDIDLLVIAEPGRVWICRRILILCVRLARLRGDELCPNFIVASNRLLMDAHDFFTAHELAQMVPLIGPAVHRQMLLANSWAFGYLPHAFAPTNLPFDKAPAKRRLRLIAERILRGRVFDAWERWEMNRLRKVTARLESFAAEGNTEVAYSESQCKGHTNGHREATMLRYHKRLRELGISEKFRMVGIFESK